ncbi:MAG: hypothetical protein U0587_11660 [Candidatus Binatia bacterium]
MTELLRILAALSMLYMHQFSQGAARFLPRRPAATPTVAVPTPRPTATATLVPTATAIPTATFTPTSLPTATATAIPLQSVSDPTGFDVVGVPPAQKLPSAVLIYPLIRVSATQDTRVEMVNLTNAAVSVSCFYVSSGTCDEIGFFLQLTPYQPVSWMASTGMNGNNVRVGVPFVGDGELKCVVTPYGPFASAAAFNALQGRAVVSDSNGQTVGYSAIAFRRLSAGSFAGTVLLDGVNYEQCPDRLHFQVLTKQSGGPDSELILVPCTEDLMNQIPSGTNVLFAVINEFEQHLSGGTALKCFNRVRFSSVPVFGFNSVGTDTAHVIVRGTDVPVVGLVIDRFATSSGAISASSNDPYLEGGRSAGIYLP